jgi:hypothetical protein
LERAKIQPCQETLAAALALSGRAAEAAAAWRILNEKQPPDAEKLVERLRPAFRQQSDLNRLVLGLKQAAQQAQDASASR